jgi:hypothetical protein
VENGNRFWSSSYHGFDSKMVATRERHPRVWVEGDGERKTCVSKEKGKMKRKREREEVEGGEADVASPPGFSNHINFDIFAFSFSRERFRWEIL